jgi:hypothetical protein
MGCYCAHKLAEGDVEDEALVQEAERFTGFSNFSFSKLCDEIDSLSQEQKTDLGKLKQLGARLKLEGGMQEEKKGSTAAFYMNLCARCNWSSRRLLLLAILLGAGDMPSKSQRLFSIYQRNGQLHALESEQLCRDLCTVALVELPEYCAERLEMLQQLDSSVLAQNYSARLKEALSTAVGEFSNRLISENSLNCSQFTVKTLSPDLTFLLSTKGIRREALAAYRKVLKEHNKPRGKARTT